MQMTRTSEFWTRAARHPLAVAFALSLLIHVTLYGTYLLFPQAFLSTKSVLSDLVNAVLRPTPNEAHLVRKLQLLPSQKLVQQMFQQPDIPLTFMEVDPALAMAEPPKNAKYYSSHNTAAANPNPQQEVKQPKIEGQQTEVPRLFNNPKPRPKPTPQPLQPAPPQPLQPAPEVAQSAKANQPPEVRPDAQPKAKSEPARPLVNIAPKTHEKSTEKPDLKPLGGQAIGDLALAKPQPEAHTNQVAGHGSPFSAGPLIAEPSPPAHVRPRTLAQAYQQNPMLAGKAMQQEGGVKRPGRISVDALASPFGVYDRAFIAAVEERWYQLIDTYRAHGGVPRQGKVVLDFELRYDGRITEMHVADRSVDELLSVLCQDAVRDPAPYQRWPTDMRQMIGADYREVRFTFYYD